ncbi:FTR1 family protein [Leptolyngbya sp. ST-U4]|uniref:FTR1 family iron permease n=1 Tax=Leptolyngbya sp. ST-U4 TaxID=2933912 RepID=UPI003296DF13
MDWSAALPTFVVTLREGVEAALVVGIVLAYLSKAGQSRLNRWVYAGIGAGVAASVAIGIVLSSVLAALETANQPSAKLTKELLETGFSLLAIGLLSWMLIWMTQQAKALKSEVEGAITSALGKSENGETGTGWGVFGLIAIAVLREGFETVLFIAAKFQQGWLPVVGAVAGLAGATVIGVLLFRLGVKINLRQFFQTMGVLLLLIVSGLVVSALRHFDRAIGLLAQINPDTNWCIGQGSSCLLGPLVWDLSSILPDRQFPGILLKALFGYTQTLYLAQAIGYILFLAIVGGLYGRSLTDRKQSPHSSKTASEQS